jgi:hypothetical protein
MVRNIHIVVFALCIMFVVGERNSYAQFGGRGGVGGIFGSPRGGRSERGDYGQNQGNRVDRLAPDSYQQTQHRLMVLEIELRLDSQQKGPWQSFSEKVLAYASDLSRERAMTGVPQSDENMSGLQGIDLATDIARKHVTELEDIRTAASALYSTLSPDQKKIADKEILTIISPGGPISGNG